MNEHQPDGKVMTLQLFSYVYLIASIIMAIYIWANMATSETSGLYSRSTATNPAGIILGIVILTSGIFGCLICLIICDLHINSQIQTESIVKIVESLEKPSVETIGKETP